VDWGGHWPVDKPLKTRAISLVMALALSLALMQLLQQNITHTPRWPQGWWGGEGGMLFAAATLPRPWPPFRPTTPQPSSRPWARAAFHYACLCCVFFMFMFSCPALGVFKMHTAH